MNLHNEGWSSMSQWDIQALQANFDNWRNERAPQLAADKAFERYAIELILRNLDLTDEEIEYGWLGGTDDGGIDGLYLVINRTLMQDDTEVPSPALTVDLILFQVKNKTSFEEDPVEKMRNFMRDLLDYARDPSSFNYYNKSVCDLMSNFRDKYTSVLGSPHKFQVIFCYATKSDNPPNLKVTQRAEGAKMLVQQAFSAASVNFYFFGCKELLSNARSAPRKKFVLDVFKHFSAPDKSVVCLVKLSDYAKFLTDENNEIRKTLLEPNVRDYQGKRNPVNADIRESLSTIGKNEFWWLNNGVTILADDCSIAGDKLTMDSPEVVNGLQTSQEIFSHFKGSDATDTRHLLVKILVLADEQTKNRVIKATNFQTPVEPLSLRATEQVHFDIEERLKLYDLYYDRKKGKYRNLLKPISKIISIRALAQTLIAIVLQRPNDARGRPQKLLSEDAEYKSIFSESVDRDLYVVCALLDRQVEQSFLQRNDLTREQRRDLRYYVDMLTCSNALNTARPTIKEIVGLLKRCTDGSLAKDIEESTKYIADIYTQLGGNDKVAKGPEMTKMLLEELTTKFPVIPAAKTG